MSDQIVLTPVPMSDLLAKFAQIVEDKLCLQQAIQQPTHPDTGEVLYTADEAASFLKISRRQLQNLTNSGEVEGDRLGGRVLYRRSKLLKALKPIAA